MKKSNIYKIVLVCLLIGVLVAVIIWSKPFTPATTDVQGFALSYSMEGQTVSLQEIRQGQDLSLDWGNESPIDGVLRQDGTTALVEAKLLIEHSGTYGFYVEARDGCSLWIDGVERYADSGVGVHKSELIEIALEAGFHDISISAYDQTTTFFIRLHMADGDTDIPIDLSQLPLVEAQMLYLPDGVTDAISLSGQVSDATTGEGLTQATVTFTYGEGQSITGQTALDGSFALIAPKGDYHTATISLTGYDTVETDMETLTESVTVTVQLAPANTGELLLETIGSAGQYTLTKSDGQGVAGTFTANETLTLPDLEIGYYTITCTFEDGTQRQAVAVIQGGATTQLTVDIDVASADGTDNYQLVENAPQWEATDLNFTIPIPQDSNPYMDTTGKIIGVFTNGDSVIEVPAFYRGDGTFTIRFTPTLVGQWTYAVTYDADNTLYYNLDEPMTDESAPYNDYYQAAFAPWAGTVLAVENTADTAHGGIAVDPDNPYHYLYEDGTTYFQMGYEVDWLGVLAQTDMEGAKTMVDMAADAGFTTIMMNVFAWDTTWCPGDDSEENFPGTDGYDFGPADSIPWLFLGEELTQETYLDENIDFTYMNEEYWNNYDEIIQYMTDKGITAHLLWKVYNKQALWPGDQNDESTIDDLVVTPEDNMYARYFISRYQGYNVIFDLGKGFNKFEAGALDYNIPEGEGAYFYFDNILREWRTTDGYQRIKSVYDSDYKYDPLSRNHYNSYITTQQGSDQNGQLTDMIQIVADQEWGYATSETWPFEIYSSAMLKKNLYGMPYFNIEPGSYQWSNEDHLATFVLGQQSPEECLRNITEVYMAGGYAMYYYTYHAWDMVKYTETPDKLYYYTNLANFIQDDVGLEDWRTMISDDTIIGNDVPENYLDYRVVGRHAMYTQGEEYLVFLGWYLSEGEEITTGTTSTTFSPNTDCTRAQIVTFLYRCLTE